MLGYMTILAGIVTALAMIVLIYSATKLNFRDTSKYIFVGLLLAAIDFIAEYSGTYWGQWHYVDSIYFIKGLVPIELIFLFFSCGVLLRYVFMNVSKIKAPIKLNTLLYLTTIFALAIYVRELYLGLDTYQLVFAVPIGIWGILNIKEKNRTAAFAIALLVMAFDLIFETIIIKAGGYSYSYNFTLLIPMAYGMLALGLLGLIEQMHKLDDFLNRPAIRRLLKSLGVYRFVNGKHGKK